MKSSGPSNVQPSRRRPCGSRRRRRGRPAPAGCRSARCPPGGCAAPPSAGIGGRACLDGSRARRVAWTDGALHVRRFGSGGRSARARGPAVRSDQRGVPASGVADASPRWRSISAVGRAARPTLVHETAGARRTVGDRPVGARSPGGRASDVPGLAFVAADVAPRPRCRSRAPISSTLGCCWLICPTRSDVVGAMVNHIDYRRSGAGRRSRVDRDRRRCVPAAISTMWRSR